ncbi:MAG: hypothetical protein ACFFA1_04145 [Promethearchaeota archaeon]
MKKFKVRIEAMGRNSEKITVTIEGNPSKEIRDLSAQVQNYIFKAVGPIPEVKEKQDLEDYIELDSLSKKQRIELLLIKNFRNGSFTSRDVREIYQQTYKEDIAINTISTYLGRLYNEAILYRSGSRAERKYRLQTAIAKRKLSSLMSYASPSKDR